MATATIARPLLGRAPLPSILKSVKRDREPCNDGAFTIDSILDNKVLPPLQCEEVNSQQQKSQENSIDASVHKKPRLNTTHTVTTTQAEVNQSILHLLHTMDSKILAMGHAIDSKIRSMDKVNQKMQMVLQTHATSMKTIIDAVAPSIEKDTILFLEHNKNAVALPLNLAPPTALPSGHLDVLAGVAVDQPKIRWAVPLHDESKNDSTPTDTFEDVPVEPSDQIGAFTGDFSDMSGDFTSNFTIIDFETKGSLKSKAHLVIKMNEDKSTYTIYDNVFQASKKTSETQYHINKALNQHLTYKDKVLNRDLSRKTWFYLEDCLSCLCATPFENQHNIAYEIAKKRIMRFKIHWHGHSHKQDTWETFENVNRVAIVEFFRDRMHMQSIIDHEPKAASWREAVQNHETKYKVVDHENSFPNNTLLLPKNPEAMTYWVTAEKLSANQQQYLDAYYLKD